MGLILIGLVRCIPSIHRLHHHITLVEAPEA